jgi:hypothetical protein
MVEGTSKIVGWKGVDIEARRTCDEIRGMNSVGSTVDTLGKYMRQISRWAHR